MGKIRGTHSTPGFYSKFTDISYAAKTLGITTLGLVGETQIGPAFDPIKVTKWDEYVNYFGNTSAEKFKGSQYPKYELPYIAKSYLTTSDQLYVCRVLGLSGYNAGPAFVITASKNNDKYVIAILRSRGKYQKYANVGSKCNPISAFDALTFDCDEIVLSAYQNIYTSINCNNGTEETTIIADTGATLDVSSLNHGQFCIQCKKNGANVGSKIPVSLNVGSKDYIYTVLGTDPNDNNSSPVFIEELYDLRLEELIENELVTKIDTAVTTLNETKLTAISESVKDILTIPANFLTKKEAGNKYLNKLTDTGVTTFEPVWDSGKTKIVCYNCGTLRSGGVYTVVPTSAIKPISGTTEYSHPFAYVLNTAENDIKSIYDSDSTIISKANEIVLPNITLSGTTGISGGTVFNEFDSSYYIMGNNSVMALQNKNAALYSFSEYQEEFRCAMSPWIVSELKGVEKSSANVKKLFRFYTITDGNYANEQIKISIANIRPDEGTFDVLIRDFNDSDGNMTILESYRGLTMVPGDSKYIGLKIGTLDGAYESKSKYVLVEVVENDMTANCVPCGFLGYPIRHYGSGLIAPTFIYNTNYDEEIKPKKQYFGLSDITGIDVDMLKYKGRTAYHDSDMTYGYTDAFHLDSTLSKEIREEMNLKVKVDGDEETSAITWQTVDYTNTLSYSNDRPIIDTESNMVNTIYEDVKLRKFTFCLYGGFDGWDIYRESRTNGDDFKANKYKGTISNGKGRTFSKLHNATALSLSGNCITSDYYAYLAGVSQFENPERCVINLFATPGLDYVNNTLLVDETVDLIENRVDALYIPTTPDKPFGASDAEDEMYSAAEAADNLDDTGIDTYYAATYYPWVKFFDKVNNKYILLPPTKDVVRNMADVDNKKYPWYAPAGLERGKVECVKTHKFTKLEDEDEVYDGRINPIKTFAEDGVKVWGNKTMYTGDTPMNRINVVRLMLYMRKLIKRASLKLIFDPNDTTLKSQFESLLKPILTSIKADRGITDYILQVSQTKEQMDAHELSAKLGVKPTPTLEYIELEFTITPQGVDFADVM